MIGNNTLNIENNSFEIEQLKLENEQIKTELEEFRKQMEELKKGGVIITNTKETHFDQTQRVIEEPTIRLFDIIMSLFN